MKIEPGERLIVGAVYCGQNVKTGKILELIPEEDDLEIGGVKYGEYKTELFRLEPEDFLLWPEGTPEHIVGDVCRKMGVDFILRPLNLRQISLISHYLAKLDTIGRNSERGG